MVIVRGVLPTAVMFIALAGTAGAGMLQAGDTFPSWQLTDQTGVSVTSSDLAGKTYLFAPPSMSSLR